MTETAAATGRWEIQVDLIDANPRQPREVFDEDRLAELTASIAAVGVLQPVVVRPASDGRYELVAGERRLRACRAAGRATIPATTRDSGDAEMLPLAVLENLHRQDLNAMELAAAYSQLVAENDLTHAELAEMLHVDRSAVTRTLALLKLPTRVQRRVAAGVLSASHADALAGLPDPTVAELLADRIVAEGLSVHTVRELIAMGGLPGAERIDGREDAARARRRRLAPPVPDDLREAAMSLGDRLDTRVRVMAGKTRGRIVVDYSNRDDLERILLLLGGAAP